MVVKSWSSEVRYLGVPPAVPPTSSTLRTPQLYSGMLAGLHLGRGQQTAAHRLKFGLFSVFIQPASQEWFLHFHMIEKKSKENYHFTICANDMQFKFQCP